MVEEGRAPLGPQDLGKVYRPGRAPMATILFIPLSAAQYNLQADWSIGLPSQAWKSSLGNAPSVCVIRLSVMASDANRLTTKTTIGFRFGAAVANLATRRSPACRFSLHPTVTIA